MAETPHASSGPPEVGTSLVPHQGQPSTWKLMLVYSRLRIFSTSSTASTYRLGLLPPPSQTPIEIGTVPSRSGCRRRSHSSAQISVAARWNCWLVSSRRVYRVMTVVPAPSSPLVRRRWRTTIAMSPRYASVLPPPVGNQIRSTMSRSSASSSSADSNVSRRKANWNGRQRRSGSAYEGSSAIGSFHSRMLPAWSGPLRIICISIAVFAIANARRATGSDSRRRTPLRIRRRAAVMRSRSRVAAPT